MRYCFAFFALAAAAPLAGQSPDPLAFLRPAAAPDDPILEAYRSQPYAPVRSGEVRSASFLTESQALPFGQVLGPVDPPVVHATQSGEAVLSGALIGVVAPAGGAYHRGDTVILAENVAGPKEWGTIVIPTGLALIGDQTPRQSVARIIAVFGPIRDGQVSLPLPPVLNPGRVTPTAVSGPAGTVISGAEPRELQQSGGEMFISMGRAAGIRIGDFIQVRRRAEKRDHTSDTIDDLMAVGQVVHVGEKASTIKLTRVIDPSIRPGTPVVRVATLPG
ncbi:MAG TPA: hypothetical protein VGM77_11725 [Gemmatimonadales bacterium]|jgi:hypothetical protein